MDEVKEKLVSLCIKRSRRFLMGGMNVRYSADKGVSLTFCVNDYVVFPRKIAEVFVAKADSIRGSIRL